MMNIKVKFKLNHKGCMLRQLTKMREIPHLHLYCPLPLTSSTHL